MPDRMTAIGNYRAAEGMRTVSSGRPLLLLALAALSACSSLGSSGPSTPSVMAGDRHRYDSSDIKIIDLDDRSLHRVVAYRQSRGFAEVFGQRPPAETVIGKGDVLDIGIWEAPPAVLFGAATFDSRMQSNNPLAQNTNMPQQMVGDDGMISLPFVGSIGVAGKTPRQVESEIVRRLSGKAHDPQAVVRLAQNETRNVTVIGEVGSSRRVPLSARGERLLDVLAAAGGPKQPVGKTTVQISRGAAATAMSLDKVIRDPAQNILLQPDDVVTVMFQPYSFTALGAVTQNAEVPFEGGGLTLAQALGRIGGLRDDRADIRGVFVFRMEDPAAIDPAISANARTTSDGRIPVIYRLNLSDATSIFASRDFEVRDHDILYVSNAPAADFQKFLTAISNAALSTIAVSNTLK